MKKIITAIVIIILTVYVLPVQATSKKISEMTFDELIKLRQTITMELFSRPEWQEVTVPQGVYKVGEDIPAGTWTVKCASENNKNYMMKECDLEWGEHLDESGHGVEWEGRWDVTTIYNPHSEYYDGGQTEYTFTVQDGDYIVIKAAYAPAVFMRYIGKPDLGFK